MELECSSDEWSEGDEIDSDEEEVGEKCIHLLSSLLPPNSECSLVSSSSLSLFSVQKSEENYATILPKTLEEFAERDYSDRLIEARSSVYDLEFVREFEKEEDLPATPEEEGEMSSSSPWDDPSVSVRHRTVPDVPPKPPIDTVRYSMNNLKESADWQLDALLEELSALETQLNSSNGDQILLGIPTLPSSVSQEKIKPSVHSASSTPTPQMSVNQPVKVEVNDPRSRVVGGVCAPSVCSSPDGDSAFGDTSSTESHRYQGSNISSGDSCRDSLNTPSPTQVSPHHNLTPEEIKAQKIREALEKMKEAKITRIFVKFFVDDGAPLQMLVDERWTVAETMHQLAEKHHMTLHEDHCVVEEFPDLYIKRIYEDHENLVENIQLWVQDSPNKLWFVRRADKYSFVDKPENYLVTERTSDHMEVPMGSNWTRDVKQEFVREYFDRENVVPPELEGWLLLKADGKKSWKKQYFVLRPSGLYCSPKGKKTSKDLQCLMNLHSNQVYSGFEWKKKYKAPTEWCFCIKLTALQMKRSSYIKYICCEDEATYRRWMVALRIAKNGRCLYSNWYSAVSRRRECLDSVVPLRVDIPRVDSQMSGIGGRSSTTHSSQADISCNGSQMKLNTVHHSPATVSRISSMTAASSERCCSAAHSTNLFDCDDLTGTIKRAPADILRRAPSHSSGSGPSIGTPEDEVDSDEETFPAPPPMVATRTSTPVQQQDRVPLSSCQSPVPPPKPLFGPPSIERSNGAPPPPVRQTPPLNLTPLAKKAPPPPPPKRSDNTRVVSASVSPLPPPSGGGHMSELEAALGRRRERIGGL